MPAAVIAPRERKSRRVAMVGMLQQWLVYGLEPVDSWAGLWWPTERLLWNKVRIVCAHKWETVI